MMLVRTQKSSFCLYQDGCRVYAFHCFLQRRIAIIEVFKISSVLTFKKLGYE